MRIARADTSNMVRRKHPASIVAGATLVALASLLGAVGPACDAAAPTWFDLPTRTRSPRGSRPGPDGMTWVASRCAAEIDRASRPDGIHVADRPGVRASTPTTSSDGTGRRDVVHRAQREPDRPAHADGELSEFYLRDLSTPTGITVGPDGALWFAQRGVSAIGRITLDGEITEWRPITPVPRRSASRPAPTGRCGSR